MQQDAEVMANFFIGFMNKSNLSLCVHYHCLAGDLKSKSSAEKEHLEQVAALACKCQIKDIY